MANKGGVNNSKAEAKWKSIQAAADKPLAKLLDGTASKSDIAEVAALLEKHSKLAHSVFKEGLEGVEKTADTLMDKMNQERIDSGKKPLSQKAHDRIHDATFQNVLAEAASDIVGMVYDAIGASNEPVSFKKKESESAFDGQLHSMLSQYAKQKPEDRATDDKRYTTSDLVDKYRKDTASVPTTPAGSAPAAGSTTPVSSPKGAEENAVEEGAEEQKSFYRRMLEKFGKRKDQDAKDEEDEEEKKSTGWMRKLREFFGGGRKKKKNDGGWVDILLKGLLTALAAPGLITMIAEKVKDIFTLDNIQKFLSDTWSTVKDAGKSVIDYILNLVGLGKKTDSQKREDAAKEMPALNKNIKDLEAKRDDAKARIAKAEADGRRPSAMDTYTVDKTTKQIDAVKKNVDEKQKLLDTAVSAAKPNVDSNGVADPNAASGTSSTPAPAPLPTDATIPKPDASTIIPATVSKPIEAVMNGTPIGGRPVSNTEVINNGRSTVDNSTQNQTQALSVAPNTTNNTVVQSQDVPTYDDSKLIIQDTSQEPEKEADRKSPTNASNAIGLGSFGMSPNVDNQLLLLNSSAL